MRKRSASIMALGKDKSSPAQIDTGKIFLYAHRGNQNMPDNIDSLQAKYLRAEAERTRLRQLNSALREQIANITRPNTMELSPVADDFLATDEKSQNEKVESISLWRNFASTNMGINKRYRIFIGYLYERMGWEVDYFCGKNLTSRKDNQIIVTLAEAAATVDLDNMYSLVGAAMECRKDNISSKVSAMCITSSVLISRVRSLAQKFSISVREHFYFRNFACVRCKADHNGGGVYYVPDDDEYLSVKVNLSEGDRYAWSEEDAEYVGFKRFKAS